MELQVGAAPPAPLLLLELLMAIPELLPVIPELLPLLPELLPLCPPLLELEMPPLLVDPVFAPDPEPELLVLPGPAPLLPELEGAADPPLELLGGGVEEPELPPEPLFPPELVAGGAVLPEEVPLPELPELGVVAEPAGAVPWLGWTDSRTVPPKGPPRGLLSVPPHAANMEPEASAAITTPVERRPIDRS